MKNLDSELKELLKENVVIVKFTKVDGQERTLNCTLQEHYLPKTVWTESKKKLNDNILSVWSIDDNGWRSFRKDSIIEYTVKNG